jgi:hypothetical protein
MVQMILARRAAGDARDEGKVSAVRGLSVASCGLLDFTFFLDEFLRAKAQVLLWLRHG